MRNLYPSQAKKGNHQNPSPADYYSLRIVHFIVFIEDYTRYTFVYFLLDKKSETCVSAFQLLQHKFDVWGYDIKRFRYDNGRGEYDNRFFRSILATRGINFERSPPYTQHKNGVAERMIGVLIEKARAMMLDSQAPPFWAEAVRTACYLHTRTSS
jgi:transposase InsO family protein